LRREFLDAAANGNLAGLIQLLSADVIFTPMAAVKPAPYQTLSTGHRRSLAR
jgi:hypothetical protein